MEDLKNHIIKLEKRLYKLEHDHALPNSHTYSKSMKLLGQICELEDIIEGLKVLTNEKYGEVYNMNA